MNALLLLLACADDPTPPAKGGADPVDSGGPPVDTATEPVDCGLDPALRLSGDPVPGATLTLSLEGEGSAVFSVSLGSVSGDQWSIPADVAVFLDESAQIEAVVSAPGCQDESASLTVTVGYPVARRVVVLSNPAVEGSQAVAEAYASARGLGEDQRCAVVSSDATTISAAEAQALLADVQACIDAAGPQVTYLVPVYGVPYKVSGQILDFALELPTVTSLDALLFFGERAAGFTEARYNPAYQEGDSMAGIYDPFVPIGELRDRGLEVYLVSRIDGSSAEEALALIDRTLDAEALRDGGGLGGIVYVDGNRGDTPPTTDEFGSYESGEWNMWGTRAIFEALGTFPVVWDGHSEEFGTAPAPTDCPDALYYAGWYSYYNYNDCFTWATGAIGGHLDSCSACDLRAPGTWSGSALQDGITATFGAVNEPYVAGMPEYDQLFLYLTQGATYGEAAYESTVVGAWMMVFVGDPLYRPFAEAGP
jgi:uncharacterized protein (TIGR03790 family)